MSETAWVKEALMPDQRSLAEQMVDVWRYARDHKMYDAQDFIAAAWQGRDLNPPINGVSRPFCTTMGHERVLADHLGIYDDGEEVDPTHTFASDETGTVHDVPYDGRPHEWETGR